jgi:hypothetical protein
MMTYGQIGPRKRLFLRAYEDQLRDITLNKHRRYVKLDSASYSIGNIFNLIIFKYI